MSEIIRLALKARIPIIRIQSDDPHNLGSLLQSLTERPVVEVKGISTSSPVRWKAGAVYYTSPSELDESAVVYEDLLSREITLVVVNPDSSEWSHARDCGSLTPSIEYLQAQLSDLLPEKQVKKITRYFVGMSLKDVIETILITQARDGALTSTGINETKSYLGAGMLGLESLDVKQEDYVPPAWAEEWFEVDAPLLDKVKYKDLWPKGFMLSGPTGTGKTELARYVAKRLGWPLYRLDLGTLYSKWQGESERNLRKVLTFISGQGESVFLLDEAEKLFGNQAVGQASLSTLLSMLLWWLQGESNRTITVMTSNDLTIIPPELYRPGRLDAVHVLNGLTKDEIPGFVEVISAKIAKQFGLAPKHLYMSVVDQYSTMEGPYVSQATLVASVRATAKRMIVEGHSEEDN